MSKSKFYITDNLWKEIKPLIPKEPASGRHRKPARLVLEGICHKIATGAAWNDLIHPSINPRTLHHHFVDWYSVGAWPQIAEILGREYPDIDFNSIYTEARNRRRQTIGSKRAK